MKKAIILFLSSIHLIFFTSCDDFLDVNDPNGRGKEEASVEGLLNSTYGIMQAKQFLAIQTETLRTDVGFPTSRPKKKKPLKVKTPNKNNDFFLQNYLSNSDEILRKWNSYYTGIARANNTIDAINSRKGANGELSEALTYQLAQARFLRGLFHFYAHSLFNDGKIIIRDASVTKETINKGVSSSDEVIKFFREDLEFGFNNLRVASETASKSFVSKGFAATILGTSYLYTEEYDTAITWFEDASIVDEYELLEGEDVLTMFTKEGEFNKEAIFELAYSADFSPSLNIRDLGLLSHDLSAFSSPKVPKTGGGGSAKAPSLLPSAWLTFAYTDEPMNAMDPRNTGRTIPLRASTMLAVVQDVTSPYYGEDFAALSVEFSETAFSFFKKYTNHDTLSNEADLPNGENRSGKNITVSRYADVLLMLAECYLQKPSPDVAKAVALIDQIRTRWGLATLANTTTNYDGSGAVDVADKDSVMNHLMYVEKPLELSAEGHSIRAIDLRRWGKFEDRYNTLLGLKFFIVQNAGLTAPSDATLKTKSKAVSQINNQAVPASKAKELVNEYTLTQVTGVRDYLPIPAQELITNL